MNQAPLTFDARKAAIVNVKRAFYCSRRCAGISPGICQRCWVAGKAPGYMRSHAECILEHRVIAMWPFNRKELNPAEQAVWDLLYRELKAYGDQNAVKSDKVLELLATPERGAFHFPDTRSFRDSILQMARKGYLIVSTVHPPYGFFIPRTEDEVIAYMGNLKARKDALEERQKVCMEFIQPPGKQLAHLGQGTEV